MELDPPPSQKKNNTKLNYNSMKFVAWNISLHHRPSLYELYALGDLYFNN